MATKSESFFCLLDELETSHKLLCAGFGCLQEIDFANDFYHLPHQLLASGLERLMKSYISLVYQDQYGAFPDMALMKKLGHDLENLQKIICTQYYGGLTRPLIKCEHEFLMNDNTLKNEIRILSQFGRYGRYYNLDVVAGDKATNIL
ncbi:hypothetical protein Enr10x_22150 [Gimesia panareensis]|uniref:Uncharacterized protein n=1 Tax=Gimesia panareensis TaxID=2527978 RepID=A0A517Q5J9_9PLAN|nr:hypothetical protein [Gimesia panareensis]QDT26903.1 hypothetical protein Enr10x_22150 [Gimesia panareensis]